MRVVCQATVPGEPTPKKRPRCGRGRAHSAEGQKVAEDDEIAFLCGFVVQLGGCWTGTENTRPELSTTQEVADVDQSTHTHAEMAKIIGRSLNAIRHRCWLFGLRRKAQPWTEEEITALVAHYNACVGKPLNLDTFASSMGRVPSNISRKARKLGMTARKRDRSDEHCRALGEGISKRWAERGHPRGALGMKHTIESRAKMSEAQKHNAAKVTPEQWEARRLKMRQTNIERYGTASPAMLSGNTYSRCTVGKREDLGGLYVRSSWEANYARYLKWLVEQGEIEKWEYEADTFVFHGETRGVITYRPDFKVTDNDGSVVYHEVKGWMDGPSKTRLARMAKHYPDVRLVVIGQKEYEAIKKWRGLIPNWEDGPRGPKYRGGRR